jgi:hypothetical protein
VQPALPIIRNKWWKMILPYRKEMRIQVENVKIEENEEKQKV